jgi:hypothetical protein
MSGISKERTDQIAGGVFIIGLAVLFMTGYWWPGIMFVIGASSLARGMAEGREWYAVQGALWTIGIGLAFAIGFSLPLLLIIVGLSMLFGYRFRPPFLSDDEDAGQTPAATAVKPKRKLQDADGLAYYDEDMEAEEANGR